METEIFINGCSTCGLNAAYIARVKAHRDNVTVYNTRYDGAAQLERHTAFLKHAGMGIDTYHAIVVEDGGATITRLSTWKP